MLLAFCIGWSGWSGFLEVERLTRTEKKTKKDEMESFFFAETLKYLYLLYAPPETVDLSKVVFNTEAHPIHRTW